MRTAGPGHAFPTLPQPLLRWMKWNWNKLLRMYYRMLKMRLIFFSGRFAASILRDDRKRDLFMPFGLGEGNQIKDHEFYCSWRWKIWSSTELQNYCDNCLGKWEGCDHNNFCVPIPRAVDLCYSISWFHSSLASDLFLQHYWKRLKPILNVVWISSQKVTKSQLRTPSPDSYRFLNSDAGAYW